MPLTPPFRRALPLTLALLLAAMPVMAQTLRIGMKAAVDGSDPHQSYSPNRNVQMQVYESLTFQTGTLQPVPGLAESWKAVDDRNWEFTLRPGVRFQDGSPLTPDDVAFSIRRASSAMTPGWRRWPTTPRAHAGCCRRRAIPTASA
ncbi:ABC transporter substrate-binding protein [Roseomonas gilardii]|uniref:ABC transporter substrate-binding protein n=1 Tax=Roseomonas gilardii TaxID=257708 RepID=A0ABU3M9P8_9PROT|nr:ABC transporter substrate-binding protein [Roseomonas gilardii]MDT8329623.1 ABC transporter substrate-binding protein [Roseomonas gilardii]